MTDDVTVAAVIPARYQSTRFPGKPLIDLCGKTMIQRVYERVNAARLVGSVVVATDDERIATSIQEIGGVAVLTDSNLPSGSDRVASAAVEISAEVIVNVQGDEPLIPPGMIDEAIQGLIDTPDAQVVTPAKIILDTEDIHNPHVVKVVTDNNGRALYFSRSPIPFVRDEKDHKRWLDRTKFLKHFGLYVYRKNILEQFVQWGQGLLEKTEHLEQLRFLEHSVWVQIIETDFESISVDTPDDAERIRKILSDSAKK